MKRTSVLTTVVMTATMLVGYSMLLPGSQAQHKEMVDIPPPSHYQTLETMLSEAPPPAPVSGARELLVLLVEFSDTPPDPTHTSAFYEQRFFDAAPPSVGHYYDEISYGTFTYVPGAVIDWYRSTSPQTVPIPFSLFPEAIGNADSVFDFGPYDTNGNGVVENEELTIYMIVSGGPAGAWHTWTQPSVPTADTNALGDPVSVEGEYSVADELRSTGTYCHELGHDLGLPDLYDTGWSPGLIADSAGLGYFGVMGMGYDWFGRIPSTGIAHMSAWSKIQLGWITPTIVTGCGTFELNDVETHAEALILRHPDHPADEYFLIENRYPANSYYESVGWPTSSGVFPDEGIVIYHIDEAKIRGWIESGQNDVNADESHKGVDVECADSPTSHILDADDLDGLAINPDWVFVSGNPGDSDDLWDSGEYDFEDESTPCNAKRYGGDESEVEIRLLSPPGPTMDVRLSVGICVDRCRAVQLSTQTAVGDEDPATYRNHGEYVSAAAQLVDDAEGISEECEACIISQFARRIPVSEQVPCMEEEWSGASLPTSNP